MNPGGFQPAFVFAQKIKYMIENQLMTMLICNTEKRKKYWKPEKRK